MKVIKSPFKFLLVLLKVRNTRLYLIFKELSIPHNKHFYKWQWKLLDSIYENKKALTRRT